MKKTLTLLVTMLLMGRVYADPSPTASPKAPDPLTAGEQRWMVSARAMVDALDAGQAAQVWSKYLSKPRRLDTTEPQLASLLHEVNQSIGPVKTATMLPRVDAPLGAVMGIPKDDVVKHEGDTTYKDNQDTLWDLQGKSGSHTYLLLTLVNENNQPRVLWLEYQGKGIKMAEYRQVEAAMKTRAEAFLGKLLKDERADIIDHDLSSQFLRRLPRDHAMSMLEDVRHHIGAVGGVTYFGGWIQHQPPGVTLDFLQKDTLPGKKPYEVLLRLAEENGAYKVDAIGDEWDNGKKKP